VGDGVVDAYVLPAGLKYESLTTKRDRISRYEKSFNMENPRDP